MAMLATALAQIPHVVAEHGCGYEDRTSTTLADSVYAPIPRTHRRQFGHR